MIKVGLITFASVELNIIDIKTKRSSLAGPGIIMFIIGAVVPVTMYFEPGK